LIAGQVSEAPKFEPREELWTRFVVLEFPHKGERHFFRPKIAPSTEKSSKDKKRGTLESKYYMIHPPSNGFLFIMTCVVFVPWKTGSFTSFFLLVI